jgi:predicted RNase H-like HicB family nuclease
MGDGRTRRCRPWKPCSIWNDLARKMKGVLMKLKITIYQDEDGVLIAECPSIPGCVSQGSSEAEAQANVTNAIRECLAVRAEMGLPSTVATREIEVLV